jgi:hypothetical protein
MRRRLAIEPVEGVAAQPADLHRCLAVLERSCPRATLWLMPRCTLSAGGVFVSKYASTQLATSSLEGWVEACCPGMAEANRGQKGVAEVSDGLFQGTQHIRHGKVFDGVCVLSKTFICFSPFVEVCRLDNDTSGC